MRLHLTDVAVRALKPQSKQFKVWDTTTPGFGVLVSGQSKSWIVMYGRDRKLKVIGRYPHVSLSDARTSAKKLLLTPAAPPTELSFKEAVSLFISNCEQRNKSRTVADYTRFLNRYFVPRFSKLEDASTKNVAAVIDTLTATPSEQNHTHTVASIFFSWCVRRGLIDASPMARLELPSRTTTRSRILSEDELRKIWVASEETILGHITRLCILLGQRRSEIGSLKWEWINRSARTINFPAEITKNGRAHTIPYGEMAEAVFNVMPQISEYLFPGRDANPTFQGWSRSKRLLDQKSGVRGWTLHDLRRTASTCWAEIGIPQNINDRLLNHVSGGQLSPVAAIYNRYQFQPEMRNAIEKWEAHLLVARFNHFEWI